MLARGVEIERGETGTSPKVEDMDLVKSRRKLDMSSFISFLPSDTEQQECCDDMMDRAAVAVLPVRSMSISSTSASGQWRTVVGMVVAAKLGGVGSLEDSPVSLKGKKPRGLSNWD